jgi:hypothetical protein
MLDDTSRLLNVWTIYRQPRDYPEGYVTVRWACIDGAEPKREEAYESATLLGARSFVPFGLYQLPPMPGEDPCVVESWI